MKTRSAAEGVSHHSALQPHVYINEWPHDQRVIKSRACLNEAIGKVGATRILEVGCGCADISGPLYNSQSVMGIDCNQAALDEAKKRYPGMFTLCTDITSHEPLLEADVVVLCETLEHVPDPEGMARRYLSKARASVISHPLDEDVNSGLSGGDHQWSFGLADFESWFRVGGHEVQAYEIFPMGSYRIILGWGKRK